MLGVLTQTNSFTKMYPSDEPVGAYSAKLPAMPWGVKLMCSSTA